MNFESALLLLSDAIAHFCIVYLYCIISSEESLNLIP